MNLATRTLVGTSLTVLFLGLWSGTAQAAPNARGWPNELSLTYSRAAVLGTLSGPTRSLAALAFHRSVVAPSLRLGGGVSWQTPRGSASSPLSLFIDAAIVYRGPLGWEPLVGLEAGWTGADDLEAPTRSWPSSLRDAYQKKVSPFYWGWVVAPLRIHERRVSVSSLALHLSQLGLSAHALRLEIEILQIGLGW